MQYWSACKPDYLVQLFLTPTPASQSSLASLDIFLNQIFTIFSWYVTFLSHIWTNNDYTGGAVAPHNGWEKIFVWLMLIDDWCVLTVHEGERQPGVNNGQHERHQRCKVSKLNTGWTMSEGCLLTADGIFS